MSISTIPTLMSVKQFSEKHPAFTEQSLRGLIFDSESPKGTRSTSKTNGFSKSIVRIGRKVLLDEAKFFEWVAIQNGGGHV